MHVQAKPADFNSSLGSLLMLMLPKSDPPQEIMRHVGALIDTVRAPYLRAPPEFNAAVLFLAV